MPWKIYSWVLTAILGFTYFSMFEETFKTPDILDVLLSLISLIGLFGYAYNKRIWKRRFWQAWLILFILWDILYNFFLSKDSEIPGVWMVAGLLLFIPEYIALYKYSFSQQSQWSQDHSSVRENSI